MVRGVMSSIVIQFLSCTVLPALFHHLGSMPTTKKKVDTNMAVKSWYLSVVDTATHKPVVHKMFFTAPEMNRFIKEKNILEEYKKPEYYIVKENY
jgi:hypothetical protein